MKIPKAAISHAIEEYPNESCGIVVSGKYIRCKNVHEKPKTDFKISSEEYFLAEDRGVIQAIIHSHPDLPAKPSDDDIKSCKDTGVPWGIISIVEGAHKDSFWMAPSDKTPLIGRPYIWGLYDCLSIVLDYYKYEFEIILGDFERPKEWGRHKSPLYEQGLVENGFYKVDSPKNGDVILMQIGCDYASHSAIYLENGIMNSEKVGHAIGDCILHHQVGMLSKRDVYGGYWLEKTVSIWRHKSFEQ